MRKEVYHLMWSMTESAHYHLSIRVVKQNYKDCLLLTADGMKITSELFSCVVRFGKHFGKALPSQTCHVAKALRTGFGTAQRC